MLVIDDDASAVELLAEQLRECDCVVLRALGGREGIDLARRFRPDLITLDLEMPEVNGFDVALGDFPAPLTPLFASITTLARLPLSGSRAMIAAVG